jgi:hypothetical protein
MSAQITVFLFMVAILTAWTVHDIQAYCERHDYQNHRED